MFEEKNLSRYSRSPLLNHFQMDKERIIETLNTHDCKTALLILLNDAKQEYLGDKVSV